MRNWYIHIKLHKTLEIDKEGNFFRYDIYFLPNIDLYYDSINSNDKYKESPLLTIQWLIFGISIWFDYDNVRRRTYEQE